MGRARAKKKVVSKAQLSSTNGPTPTSVKAPAVSALLEKAQELIAQYDYELAERFVKRILDQQPNHVEAKEMLGIVQLETGELDEAKKVCIFAYWLR